MRPYWLLPALAFSLGAAPAPAAASLFDDIIKVNRVNVPRAEWQSPAQIIEKLTAEGYQVREIEADDGVYEVEATDKNGVKIEFHVHPGTGEILHGYDD